MSTVTLGLKVDEALRGRIRAAATQQGRAPHWLIKQAVLHYVEAIERGLIPPGATLSSTDRLLLPDAEDVEALAQYEAVAPAPQPFLEWAQNVLPQTDLRAAITAAWHRPEEECLPLLVQLAHTPDATQCAAIEAVATRLVDGLRGKKDSGGVEALVQEFSLSSQEGVALMCLAEALLRIPVDVCQRRRLGPDADWEADLDQQREKSGLVADPPDWQGRRAADPAGRAPRHEAHGRTVRHWADDF